MNILWDYRQFEHKICLRCLYLFFFVLSQKEEMNPKEALSRDSRVCIDSDILSFMALGHKFGFAIIKENNTRGHLC